MRTRNTQAYSLLLLIADAVVIFAAFVIAYVIRVQHDPRPLLAPVYAREFATTAAIILPFWLFIFATLGLFNRRFYERTWQEAGRLLLGVFLGILLILGYSYVTDQPFFPARLVAVYSFIAAFLLLFVERRFLHLIRFALIRRGYAIHRTLLIGNTDTAGKIARELEANVKSAYRIVAIAGPKEIAKGSSAKYYQSASDALHHLKFHKIDTVIQTDLFEDEDKNRTIFEATQIRHIQYHFIPGNAEFYSGKNTVSVLFGLPMISVYQTPLIGWGAIVKAIFDAIVTVILLTVLSPVLLLVTLLQLIFNPGPVLYRSKRLSQYSRPFTLYKFRSMRPEYGGRDAAEEFEAIGREDLAAEYRVYRKVKHDPRITRFGNFLRVTSLDELPQLFNVLKGDLSLVGPRPILPQEVTFGDGRAALLHSVKSGVTGLWQVSGRSSLSFAERIDLELYYAQNWTFWLDLKILFRTLVVVIKQTNAH
jgi:exopolysaccharide biosynthesis polyprenyl glycosylphosphotransferase